MRFTTSGMVSTNCILKSNSATFQHEYGHGLKSCTKESLDVARERARNVRVHFMIALMLMLIRLSMGIGKSIVIIIISNIIDEYIIGLRIGAYRPVMLL